MKKAAPDGTARYEKSPVRGWFRVFCPHGVVCLSGYGLEVMDMPRNSKQTSKRAASAASKVLRDKRTGKASKIAAASALSQAPKRRK